MSLRSTSLLHLEVFSYPCSSLFSILKQYLHILVAFKVDIKHITLFPSPSPPPILTLYVHILLSIPFTGFHVWSGVLDYRWLGFGVIRELNISEQSCLQVYLDPGFEFHNVFNDVSFLLLWWSPLCSVFVMFVFNHMHVWCYYHVAMFVCVM